MRNISSRRSLSVPPLAILVSYFRSLSIFLSSLNRSDFVSVFYLNSDEEQYNKLVKKYEGFSSSEEAANSHSRSKRGAALTFPNWSKNSDGVVEIPYEFSNISESFVNVRI